MEDKFEIGCRIVCIGKNDLFEQIGAVKWKGEIPGSKGSWIGVELDLPKGKHSGASRGVQYFTCKAGHGLFLKPTDIKLYADYILENPEFVSKLQPVVETPEVAQQKNLTDMVSLRNSIKEKDQELTTLRNSVTSSKKTESVLNTEINKHVKQIAELKDIVQKKDQEIKNLNDELFKANQNSFSKRFEGSEDSQINELNQFVEQLTLEKENLEQEKEMLTLELEDAREQIKNLELEKEMFLLESENAASGEAGNENNSNAQELLKKNALLKSAIVSLNEKIEKLEIVNHDLGVELKKKNELIPKLADKIKNSDEVLGVIQSKETEIKELTERVNDYSNVEQIVEQLTTDLLNKEEEMINLKKEISELKKSDELNSIIINQQDELLKSFEMTVENKDEDIELMNNKLAEYEDTIGSLQEQIKKLREKVNVLIKEVEIYRDKESVVPNVNVQISSSIQNLMGNMSKITEELRKTRKSLLETRFEEIKSKCSAEKMNTYLKALSPAYLDSVKIHSLDRYSYVLNLGKKAFVVLEVFLTQYIIQNSVEERNIGWASDVFEVLNETCYLSFICCGLMRALPNLALLDYLARSDILKIVVGINAFIEQFSKWLIEETLTPGLALENIKVLLKKTDEGLTQYMSKQNCDLNFVNVEKVQRARRTIAKTLGIIKILVNQSVFARAEENKLWDDLEKISYFYLNKNYEQKFKLEMNAYNEFCTSASNAIENLQNPAITNDAEKKLEAEKNLIDFSKKLITLSYKPARRESVLEADDGEVEKTSAWSGAWEEKYNGIREELQKIHEHQELFKELQKNYENQTVELANAVKELNDVKKMRDELENRVKYLREKETALIYTDKELKQVKEKSDNLEKILNSTKLEKDRFAAKIQQLETDLKNVANISSTAVQPKTSSKINASMGAIKLRNAIKMKLDENKSAASISLEELQQSDERRENLMLHLNLENIYLKGKNMKEALIKLQRETPELAKKGEFNLNDEQNAELSEILKNIKQNTDQSKFLCANAKIINLKEIDSLPAEKRKDTLLNIINSKDSGMEQYLQSSKMYIDKAFSLLQPANQSFNDKYVNDKIKSLAKSLTDGQHIKVGEYKMKNVFGNISGSFAMEYSSLLKDGIYQELLKLV